MTGSASVDVVSRLFRSLTPFVDPLPMPPRRVITEPTRLHVHVRAATHQFHSEMPPSRVWTYDGHLPGPTIEVRRGVAVEVQWDNRLDGALPVTVVRAPSFEVDGVPVQCVPGRSGVARARICHSIATRLRRLRSRNGRGSGARWH